MSKFFNRPLADLTSATANLGVNISDLESQDLWVLGTFVATAQAQVSPDNVNWIDEGSPVTAPGRISIPNDAKFARLDVTAFTSGTVESVITGVDADLKG